MKITTVGIDLAKNVFAVHGVNEHGRTVLKKVLKRNHVAGFFANLPRVKQDESRIDSGFLLPGEGRCLM
ncbi:transposase [Paraburkholderia sp. 35.1]